VTVRFFAHFNNPQDKVISPNSLIVDLSRNQSIVAGVDIWQGVAETLAANLAETT
jgi:hypothetical protein